MSASDEKVVLIEFVEWMNANAILGQYLVLVPESIVDVYSKNKTKKVKKCLSTTK